MWLKKINFRLKNFIQYDYKIRYVLSLENESRVVKPPLYKIMQNIIISAIFYIILFNGCSSNVQNLKSSFDPEYQVVDRGNIDVIVKSRACAFIAEDAVSGAKRNAAFHLRSVIGAQNYRSEFHEVKRYNEGNKICVEISVASLPPL